MQVMWSSSSQFQEAAQQWVRWDPNSETRSEIEELLQSGDAEALEKKFSQRIEFGTAGLRGVMAAGPLCMNDLVVIQSTQGLCSSKLTPAVCSKSSPNGIKDVRVSAGCCTVSVALS